MLYIYLLFLCYAALRSWKKRRMQTEDSMESRMLMDVMKELRDAGVLHTSVVWLFEITYNAQETILSFFVLHWSFNYFFITVFVIPRFKMLYVVSTACPTRMFFISIAEDVRKLPTVQRMQIQCKVLKILLECKEGENL